MWETIAVIAGIVATVLGWILKLSNDQKLFAEQQLKEQKERYEKMLNERTIGHASNTPSGVFNAANEHAPVHTPVSRPNKRERGSNPFSGR
jgi:hypothetical protein